MQVQLSKELETGDVGDTEAVSLFTDRVHHDLIEFSEGLCGTSA